MRVLIIPEDFRKDQWIVEPIVRAMLTRLGRPQAKVTTCKDPLLGSISQALKESRLREITGRYKGMVDLFLLLIDRDGEPGRRAALNSLESKMQPLAFFGENAWQELEVWLLAGSTLPKDWDWKTIRGERDPKERYYGPFALARSLANGPGEGRKQLGLEAGRNYQRVRKLCPEDVQNLEKRLAVWLAAV